LHGRDLVDMLARFLDNSIYLNITSPWAVCSLTKWCFTSMCLVHWWFLLLMLFEINSLLSAWILIDDLIGSLILLKNFVSYNAWVVALVKATYSALTVKSVTTSWHLLSYRTGPPATINMFPSVKCYYILYFWLWLVLFIFFSLLLWSLISYLIQSRNIISQTRRSIIF